jgi:hypothetical protein
MNTKEIKREIMELGKSPVAEKLYPVTSDWVPVVDVLAIINRFEKHWQQFIKSVKSDEKRELFEEIFGKTQ